MTENDLQKRLVENLKRVRKERGLTQEGLAEKAGLSSQIINDIEGGRRWPRRTTLSKITDALDVDVQRLFSAGLPSPLAAFSAGVKGLAGVAAVAAIPTPKQKFIERIQEFLDEIKNDGEE